MKKQKKLKKFNKSLSRTPAKSKAAKKPAAFKSAHKAVKAMAPSKAGKKPAAKAAPKKADSAKAAKTASKSGGKSITSKLVAAASNLLSSKKAAQAPAPAKGKAASKATPNKAAAGKQLLVAAVMSKTVVTATKSAKGSEPAAVKGAGKKGKSLKSMGVQLPDGTYEKMCRENACENVATTKGYCRLDYIKNWKKIKRKEMILKEGKLNQYIEELVGKYPDKYIDVIRQDLSSEVNFNKVIHDLELDESIDDLDYDGDSIDSLIGSIKKEDGGFDDEEF